MEESKKLAVLQGEGEQGVRPDSLVSGLSSLEELRLRLQGVAG